MRVLSTALTIVASVGALAQTPSPRVRSITEELRIDAHTLGIERVSVIAQGADGRIAIATPFGESGAIHLVDSAGHPQPSNVRVGRNGDADVLYPQHIGWIAGTSTMWIADPGFSQVALVDASGTVVKSIESSSWVHPHWSQRRAFPVFGGMEAVAVYPDSTMLVIPFKPRSLLDTPGYDRSQTRLLRITWGGAIQRSVAVLPREADRIALRSGDCQRFIPVPLAPRRTWATSFDGKRIGIAVSGVSRTDSGTVRVVSLNEHGDTVFARTIAQPAQRVQQSIVDSLLSRTRSCGSLSAQQIRDSITRRIPPFRSFVASVVVGRDYTTWVTLKDLIDNTQPQTLIELDPDGTEIGSVTLPPGESLEAAERNRIWAVEYGGRRSANALIRYRLGPTAAPPSRSGRPSASSTRSHPPA